MTRLSAVLGLLVALLGAPAPGLAAGFTVKYRTATNVYLDAGRAQGLVVGDRLRVVAGEATIAELEVLFAADQSASCRVSNETRPVRAGDVAVLLPRKDAPDPVVPAAPSPADGAAAPLASSPAVKPATPRPLARVRGGASFGYYQVFDESPAGLDFQQRTGRLDLTFYDIDGRPLTFNVRFRTRQDVRAQALSFRNPKDQRDDRFYELSLRYQPPSDRFGFEVGRIGIQRFVGVGYLDGALAHWRLLPQVRIGGFFGRRSDIDGLGFEGSGQKYGAFVSLAPASPWSRGGFEAVLAGVREFSGSEISREYLSLESRLGSGSRWNLFERAELDLNRGWRKELAGESAQLSTLSLSTSYRTSPTTSLFASYDSRRNYRAFWNRDVPENVFDDLLHQGLRAGLTYGRALGVSVSGSLGVRFKEQSQAFPELDQANAYSVNASIRHGNLWSRRVSVGLDASGFRNSYTEGALLSAHVGRTFRSGHLLDFSYGASRYRVLATSENRTTQWLRLNGRAELTRKVYLGADFEYDMGDDLKGPRGFLELGYQF
jgi:hypothetical protein